MTFTHHAEVAALPPGVRRKPPAGWRLSCGRPLNTTATGRLRTDARRRRAYAVRMAKEIALTDDELAALAAVDGAHCRISTASPVQSTPDRAAAGRAPGVAERAALPPRLSSPESFTDLAGDQMAVKDQPARQSLGLVVRIHFCRRVVRELSVLKQVSDFPLRRAPGHSRRRPA